MSNSLTLKDRILYSLYLNGWSNSLNSMDMSLKEGQLLVDRAHAACFENQEIAGVSLIVLRRRASLYAKSGNLNGAVYCASRDLLQVLNLRTASIPRRGNAQAASLSVSEPKTSPCAIPVRKKRIPERVNFRQKLNL